MIFFQIVIDDPPKPFVVDAMLIKREADTPDHAADELAPCCFSVQNAAGTKYADHSRDPHLPEIGIHVNLRELSAKGK